VLDETAEKTDQGAGICVGRRFDTIEWRVIRITDKPIAFIEQAEQLPPGEIGELLVRGPQASPCYVTRTECNAESKISDDVQHLDKETRRQVDKENASAATSPCLPVSLSPGPSSPWHRMGDVGYLDGHGRFWYCGRKSQRVETTNGPLYTECIEAIFNQCPAVSRTALVGVGPRGAQTPVLVFESTHELRCCGSRVAPRYSYLQMVEMLRAWSERHPLTERIQHYLQHGNLPVDPRHNAKINRELLAEWASKRLPELR
jgi:acyl-CoA synthetase (AMP-forming)/AMP-acid ligase II